MAKQVHIVPHFHWDREWYFTAEESKILLVNDMEEILERLETDENYPCFILDGQTCVLEDYFEVAPENRERTEKLIREGKLRIGPWYTQTDEMVVGGESILRNLLYGLRDSRKIGEPMMIGYLPDSFGQSARMPQILNGFGIERSLFWRGTSERMGTDKTEFYWEDEDGSRVVVQLLPLGYAIGKYLPEEREALKKRMEKYMPVLERGNTTGHLLVPNGHDQMPIQKNIVPVMEQMKNLYPDKEFVLSDYEALFEVAEKTPGLDTLHGEFLDGKYMRVHRSIYSSRADLKASNTRIENKITNCLEPLASIAYSLGFPYHHSLFEAIWKELLKNHAHDSMGCCCSDKVHRAIADRYFLAEERTDRLMEFYMRKIADAVADSDGTGDTDKLVVFNCLPYSRSGVVQAEITTRMKTFCLKAEDGRKIDFEIRESEIVDPGLIDRQIVHYGNYDPFVRYKVEFFDEIPAMGYRTYAILEDSFNSSNNSSKLEANETSTKPVLENEYLKVMIEENGTLTITDKTDQSVYRKILMIEDGSDDGDGYDYSPLKEDFVITSEFEKAEIQCQRGAYAQNAKIKVSMAIPKNLSSRKMRERDGSVEVVFDLELKKADPVLGVNVTVKNTADDHRIRLLLPDQDSRGYSVSDNQFGSIQRLVVDPAIKVWEKEKWSERPDAIYPFLSYVSGLGKGVGVITDSVREYELTGNQADTLAITLMRSVGVLGKEELFRRPGRPSGIKMQTPDSQLHGTYTFRLGLTCHLESLPERAKEYLTPLLAYNKMGYHAMKLNPSPFKTPWTYSLFCMESETGQTPVLSALKKAEDGAGLIARFYNPYQKKNRFDVKSAEWKLSKEVKMDENEGIADCENGSAEVSHNQVKTFLLERA